MSMMHYLSQMISLQYGATNFQVGATWWWWMINYMAHRSKDLIIPYLYHLAKTNRFISLEVHWEVHWWTMLLHRARIFCSGFFSQVFFLRRKLLSCKDSLQFSISGFFCGGFPMRFSPISSIVLRNIFYSLFRLYLGDLWSCYKGP